MSHLCYNYNTNTIAQTEWLSIQPIILYDTHLTNFQSFSSIFFLPKNVYIQWVQGSHCGTDEKIMQKLAKWHNVCCIIRKYLLCVTENSYWYKCWTTNFRVLKCDFGSSLSTSFKQFKLTSGSSASSILAATLTIS